MTAARLCGAGNTAGLTETIGAVVRYAQTAEAQVGFHKTVESLAVFRATPRRSTQDIEELEIQESDFNLALVGAHARANSKKAARDRA